MANTDVYKPEKYAPQGDVVCTLFDRDDYIVRRTGFTNEEVENHNAPKYHVESPRSEYLLYPYPYGDSGKSLFYVNSARMALNAKIRGRELFEEINDTLKPVS